MRNLLSCFLLALLTFVPCSLSAQLDAPAPKIRREPTHVRGAQPAAPAPTKAVSAPATAVRPVQTLVDTTEIDNTMLLGITSLFRSGNYAEARKGATSLVANAGNIQDSATVHYRCFASQPEKALYEIMQERAGGTVRVEWLPEPIAEGFYFLGMISFHEGKNQEALGFMQQAIQWSPTRAAFHSERAYMLLNSGESFDLAMAMASYLKALEMSDNESDFALALRGLGFCHIERQNMEVALACYLRSQAYDPDNTAAKEEISFINASHPGLAEQMNDNQVLQMLRNNSIPERIAPIHADALLRFADQLPNSGQHKKQLLAVLRRAAKIAPEHPEVAKRLKAAGQ